MVDVFGDDGMDEEAVDDVVEGCVDVEHCSGYWKAPDIRVVQNASDDCMYVIGRIARGETKGSCARPVLMLSIEGPPCAMVPLSG